MAYVGYEQLAVSSAVKTVSDLTIPAKTQWAVLQAETQNVRYTMDGTAPTTSTGMILVAGATQIEVTVSELRAIKVIRDGGSDAVLNIHYSAGRDI